MKIEKHSETHRDASFVRQGLLSTCEEEHSPSGPGLSDGPEAGTIEQNCGAGLWRWGGSIVITAVDCDTTCKFVKYAPVHPS